MKESHWIIDAIAELDEEAQRQGQTSVMLGLSHVLEKFMLEVSSVQDSAEPQKEVSYSVELF
jgi:hypothetical protein